MKINELLSEHELDEIDRRGFLKGLGAAAGLAAVGKVSAASLKKNVSTDPMSGEKSNDFNIKSEDGRATLYIRAELDPEKWTGSSTILQLSNDTFDWFATNGAMRIKIGNNPPESIRFDLSGSARQASIGAPGSWGRYGGDFERMLVKHKGQVLIQVPTKKHGMDPIKFKID